MIVDKDFSHWALVKSGLDVVDPPNYFFEGEVWWASLGVNIGHELNGKFPSYSRPIVILKTFSRSSLFYVPLTTAKEDRIKPFLFYVGEVIPGKQSNASLSHASSMDGRRLLAKIGNLEQNLFNDLKKATKVYIFS